MVNHALSKVLRLLAGPAIGVILVIGAPGAVSAGTDARGSVSSAVGPTATQSEPITSLLGGIPETANVLGSPTAPVTLVYFGDLECPICREFTLGALPLLIRRWVRVGDLRIAYRSLETATRSPETFKKQQIAAYAAGAQNKAWYFIEIFYHEQREEGTSYVTGRYLDYIARQVRGLKLERWQRARRLSRYSAELERDARAADKLGLTGTPSFQIGRTGGPLKRLEPESLTDPQSFNRAIEGVLADS